MVAAMLKGSSDRVSVSIYPQPTRSDIDRLAADWQLHPVLVEDLVDAGQRTKLERYGDVTFLSLRSAIYKDEAETVGFFEFHVLMRPGMIAILCQGRRWIDGSEDFGAGVLDGEQVMADDAHGVIFHLLDDIVDGYFPVIDGLINDKEEIENQVFAGDGTAPQRIYRLSREIVEVQHAIDSLTRILLTLRDQAKSEQLSIDARAFLRDVDDHLTRVSADIAGLHDALTQILSVNATLVAQRQNEDMKKISGWAAILVVPTLIAGIYGMNFSNIPELHWTYGYPLSLGLMAVCAAILYVIFKKKHWM